MNFYFIHIFSFFNIFKEYFIAAPPSVKIFVQFFEHTASVVTYWSEKISNATVICSPNLGHVELL